MLIELACKLVEAVLLPVYECREKLWLHTTEGKRWLAEQAQLKVIQATLDTPKETTTKNDVQTIAPAHPTEGLDLVAFSVEACKLTAGLLGTTVTPYISRSDRKGKRINVAKPADAVKTSVALSMHGQDLFTYDTVLN